MLYEELLKNIGLRLKYERMKKGLTQAQLADLLSSEMNDIGKIERGQRNITLKTLYNVAQALNINPRELFDFKD